MSGTNEPSAAMSGTKEPSVAMSGGRSSRGLAWRLAWAQVQAHRTYSAWITGLLVLLVGVITYVMVMGFTQVALQRDAWHLVGGDRERQAFFDVGWQDPLPDGTTMERYDADMVKRVILGSGAQDAIGLAQNVILTSPDKGLWDESASLAGAAVLGVGSFALPVVEGRAPAARGEVALAADRAAELQVGVGDTVTLYRPTYQFDTGGTFYEPVELTVVSLTTSRAFGGFDSYAAEAWFDWSEATEPGGMLFYEGTAAEGRTFGIGAVMVRWNGASPLLDPYLDYYGSDDFFLGSALPDGTAPWFMAAGVLVAAMILMSFAVGRSQAAARTQWVATARTLGARRRHIAQAIIAETLILAGAAVVAGVLLGWLVSQLLYTSARSQALYPAGSGLVSMHWSVVPIVAAVVLVVGVIISVVPAFWATRVAPVAALKPVSDVTEAELSRRVSVLWLWIPVVGAIAFLAFARTFAISLRDAGILFSLTVIVLAGGALLIESLRQTIPQVGRALARSRHPAVLTAGDLLSGRPRQAVAPALVVTCAALALTVFALAGAGLGGSESGWGRAPWQPGTWAQAWEAVVPPAARPGLVIAALALVLVMAAMFVSQRLATSSEIATRTALGLSHAHTVTAHTLQQWLPQVVGAVTGLVTGAIFMVLLEVLPGTATAERDITYGGAWDSVLDPAAVLAAFLVALVLTAILLAMGFVTSWAVAAWRGAGASASPRARSQIGG